MNDEQFYGMTNDELFDFVKKCKNDNEEFKNLLKLKNTEIIQLFIKICKNFEGASIKSFIYATSNTNPRILSKKTNFIRLTLGVNTFFPGLRYGETYYNEVCLVFTDLIELRYVPVGINEYAEISIDKFSVENNNYCVFQCHKKDDAQKIFYIKSKDVFVEDFISKDRNSMKDARWFYDNRRYEECISELKNNYSQLDSNAGANNLMGLCYDNLKNRNDAVFYYNRAIVLNGENPVYFYNKACALYFSGLINEALKNFNKALSLEVNESFAREITKKIVDIVDAKMYVFNNSLLIGDNVKKFLEYIFYFDTVINLKYCFSEYKEKFIEYKKETVCYFIERIKKYSMHYISNYSDGEYERIKMCNAVLSVSGITQEQIKICKEILKECENNIQREFEWEKLEKVRNDVASMIYSLAGKCHSAKEIEKVVLEKYPKYDSIELIKKIRSALFEEKKSIVFDLVNERRYSAEEIKNIVKTNIPDCNEKELESFINFLLKKQSDDIKI